jgi:hypothetical protein
MKSESLTTDADTPLVEKLSVKVELPPQQAKLPPTSPPAILELVPPFEVVTLDVNETAPQPSYSRSSR